MVLLRLITDGPTDKSPGPFFGPADVGPWTFLSSHGAGALKEVLSSERHSFFLLGSIQYEISATSFFIDPSQLILH